MIHLLLKIMNNLIYLFLIYFTLKLIINNTYILSLSLLENDMKGV